MIFLEDGSVSVSYENLISKINCSDFFINHFLYTDLFSFYTNFLTAITHHQNITIIDNDLSDEELKNLEIIVNQKKDLQEKNHITSTEDLISKILNSKSEIHIYTSGTTGQPKKVSHKINNLTKNVRISESLKNVNWALAYNITHMSGLQICFQAILNESSLNYIFDKNRDYIFSLLTSEKITHFSATPTFYRLLTPFSKKFETVKRITLSGEKPNHILLKELSEAFPNARINNIYASTEGGALFSSHDDVFRIKEENKNYIKIKNNELFLHKFLLGNSEAFKFDEEDFYATNDLVEFLDDNKTEFRFLARKNELINVGGYGVNPQEIEDILHLNSKISDCRVFGKPHQLMGNVLCAEIVLQEKETLTEQEVRHFLNEKLQNYKIPRIIKFTHFLSQTKTGKKLKN